ncbi:uncharacterized protein LOC114517653 [Dendronephthya gigantea]|uniref:uncharacterized protein LOC114517653 n=1 Tax=Dendronephthya gigantea TaxID=151771 RepID=UPI00106CCD59|nr:uncharacterized protein LOC114517653 [Dendronephthya gigantea]
MSFNDAFSISPSIMVSTIKQWMITKATELSREMLRSRDSEQNDKAKVFLYKDDYNAMCTEVYRHQDIETGGNLFGLWTTSGSAMIHVVLGPGQNCRRTNTSFHQDINYMHRVGRFINDNYMLCHIGEWHSHHNLWLSKPSHGDVQTIERNFPKGISKFLVIIANIRNQDTILLSPYFFTNGGKHYEKAEFEVIDIDNPFLNDEKITAEIEFESERSKRRQNYVVRPDSAPSIVRNMPLKAQQRSKTNPTLLQVSKHTPTNTPKPRDISTPLSKANPSALESQSKSISVFDHCKSAARMNCGSSQTVQQEEPIGTNENATSVSQLDSTEGNQNGPKSNENDGEGNASSQSPLDSTEGNQNNPKSNKNYGEGDASAVSQLDSTEDNQNDTKPEENDGEGGASAVSQLDSTEGNQNDTKPEENDGEGDPSAVSQLDSTEGNQNDTKPEENDGEGGASAVSQLDSTEGNQNDTKPEENYVEGNPSSVSQLDSTEGNQNDQKPEENDGEGGASAVSQLDSTEGNQNDPKPEKNYGEGAASAVSKLDSTEGNQNDPKSEENDGEGDASAVSQLDSTEGNQNDPKPEENDGKGDVSAVSQLDSTEGNQNDPKPEENDGKGDVSAVSQLDSTEGNQNDPKPEENDGEGDASAVSQLDSTEGNQNDPKPEENDGKGDVSAVSQLDSTEGNQNDPKPEENDGEGNASSVSQIDSTGRSQNDNWLRICHFHTVSTTRQQLQGRPLKLTFVSRMARIPQSRHKVYLFEDDYNAICAEVYRHPHIETGGNLFGLWTTSGSAMIHVVLGPGQKCRRTNTSFHQDINYMQRVGRFVNDGFMQCHIGEWHSHHNLSLDRPSQGDVQTVERNFPEGMSKFLVIITNIKSSDTISLSPYFFTHDRKPYEKAEYVVLKNQNPYLSNVDILNQIQQGAENRNFHQNGATLRSRASLTAAGNSQSTGSDSQRNHSTSHTNSSRGWTGFQNSSNTASNSQRDLDNSPTYAQVATPSSGANEIEPMDTSDTSPHENHPTLQISSPVDHNPPGGSASNNQNDDVEKASPKEVILKEIYDELKKFFGSEGNIEIESGSAGDIQMTFKHRIYHWKVRFPESFPNKPAQLFSSSSCDSLSYARPFSHDALVDQLTSLTNILLSIKKSCRSTCETCKRIKKKDPEIVTPKSDTSPRLAGNSDQYEKNALKNQATNDEGKREVALKEIHDDLQKYFGKEGEVVAKRENDGEIQINFQHSGYHWKLRFPKTFPNGQPARLSRSLWPESESRSTTHLDNSLENRVKIFLCIKKNCKYFCAICKDITEEKLTKPAATTSTVKTNHADTVIALENDIKMTLATPLTFTGKAQDDGSYRIAFTHYQNKWSIMLPAKFPDKPAEVHKQATRYSDPEKQFIRDSSGRPREDKPLISFELIMKAIRSNCFCSQCHKIF